jgi:ADP-heptose:LPS heptosyltransferase
MPTKVILNCGYSPGDIVLLSAAVRDLHLHYPGTFVTDVRTPCPEIWENNPHITAIRDDDPEATFIDCGIPLLNRSNEAPYHALHGFIEFLNEKLGISVRPTLFKGDIHLSKQEKAWFSQVHESTGTDIPFWIVAAGGKYDVTIKWWHASRYQEVVDRLRGKIQFVQVGEHGHYHPKLNGVIDLRGKTTLRELVRLVYHSQGVLCSVTALMHLAAAVESKNRNASVRPAVVIAGGREPAHWEAYPGHRFLDTIGLLPCCKKGGCWRDRVLPLRDGDLRDKPDNLCVSTINGLPRCLDMISPADVARHIEMYAEGGVIKYLSTEEFKAAQKGIYATVDNDFDRQPLNLQSAGIFSDEAIKQFPTERPVWKGRGIVICGGGVKYFTNAWVGLNMLRRTGCTLPVEVWHLGKNEMTDRMSKLLSTLGAKTVDALKIQRTHPMRLLNGWALKPYSIFHSTFNEVLLLDADNVPVVNPEFLFDCKEFIDAGAVFWPDFDYVTGKCPSAIWRSFGLRRPSEGEFESGQILINKTQCALPLRLCLWINENCDFYYRYLHGDKETFRLAFRKFKKSYFLIKTPIHPLEATMCQHDFEGRRIFQHRNLDKWDLIINRRIQGFWFENECLSYIAKLRTLWNGSLRKVQYRVPLARKSGKVPKIAVVVIDNKRQRLLQTIEHLKRTGWNGRILRVVGGRSRSVTVKTRTMVAKCLEESPDFILFLVGHVILNQHLYHNLLKWNILRMHQPPMTSLYNPQLSEIVCDVENSARLVDPKHMVDGVAIMMNQYAAHLFLLGRNRSSALDVEFIRIARRLKRLVYFHGPSLIQRGVPANGKPVNQAADFDARWRA